MSRKPLFLARQAYRRRRLLDAARILPLFGAGLFMLPLLRSEQAGLSAGLVIWFFAAWAGLIAAGAVLARQIAAGVEEPGMQEGPAPEASDEGPAPDTAPPDTGSPAAEPGR